MVELSGGTFVMGSDDALAYPEDGEASQEAEVRPFKIDAHAVSNTRFIRFVADTGYETDAQRFGWSFVFGGLLPDDFPPTRGVAAAPWWRQVYGADWCHPEGPQSDLDGRDDHPVVHVSLNDAHAYCVWSGLGLPTEAEWEFAARGGLERKVFPWGDELEPGSEHRMNVWQGKFPSVNTAADGYHGTCPTGAFAPNGYGLYEMTGNVWEWTGTSFDDSFRGHAGRRQGAEVLESAQAVQKGGSFLCHASYCRRYRVAARQGNTPDTSAQNVGFRCAAGIEKQ